MVVLTLLNNIINGKSTWKFSQRKRVNLAGITILPSIFEAKNGRISTKKPQDAFRKLRPEREPKPDGTMGAVEGAKDDLVISTAGGVWLATSYMSLPKMIRSGTGKRLRQRKTEAVI